MYDSSVYAASRLNDTVVMMKRKPMYVARVVGDMRAVVRPFTKNGMGKGQTVPLSTLNVLDFKLGFLNKGTSATYVSRRTLRHDWRQGLRLGNVNSSNIRLELKDIAQTLLQRYPTYKEAYVNVMDKGYDMCAWCTDFALTNLGKLVWRYEVVGTYSADNKIVLDKKFKFLINELKENTRGCCEVF